MCLSATTTRRCFGSPGHRPGGVRVRRSETEADKRNPFRRTTGLRQPVESLWVERRQEAFIYNSPSRSRLEQATSQDPTSCPLRGPGHQSCPGEPKTPDLCQPLWFVLAVGGPDGLPAFLMLLRASTGPVVSASLYHGAGHLGRQRSTGILPVGQHGQDGRATPPHDPGNGAWHPLGAYHLAPASVTPSHVIPLAGAAATVRSEASRRLANV